MFFGKKKKEESLCCSGKCCDKNYTHEVAKKNGVLILGAGCVKCNELEENTKKAMKELNIDKEIYHITDYAEMASYGVMSTPALVVDGNVLFAGRVLSKDAVKEILAKTIG